VYCTSNQQSALPKVLVGPVDELQITIPAVNALPKGAVSKAKLDCGGT
jgi:hypothetical protein